ncbi:hypothetical protein JCM30237_19630 [Halolamina litorea]|uniref:MYXO-CTERM domain-containing protein n=1 Tax=Halolamina litorea TaxID=1515593 RepID=A0ABD6BUN9_9EURY|nr:hypothetical protein [Halolamina litorea]
MSDKQFTFFEFHFHDGFQLGPSSLETGDGEDADVAERTAAAPESAPESDTSGGSGPSVLGPLLGLGVLAGLAYAVRKLLAGVEPEGLDALDDIEDEVEGEDAVPIEITSPDEETGGVPGAAIAVMVGVLLVLALVARKLLGGSEEIVVEE